MKKPPSQHSFFARAFLSPSENRLRAGWRLLIQTLLLLTLTVCIGIILAIPSAILNYNFDRMMLFLEVVLLFAITLSIFLARRFLDKRTFASMGLVLKWQALYDLLAGFVIAALMMGVIYGLLWSLGWIHFEGYAWVSNGAVYATGNAILWLVIFILTGWNEELLNRGYYLQNLADGLNPSGTASRHGLIWGVILSSVIFGVLHFGNPFATWVSTGNIVLAGLFLAYAYVRMRQLWLSIGLHIGWNFFEGVVFGFPVSGIDTLHLIKHTVTGPELWTGGYFGPEAGLILIPVLAFGIVLIYLYTRPEIRE